MRLHAVLGYSTVTLANALLCTDWDQIILYSPSKKMAKDIVSRITKSMAGTKFSKKLNPQIVEIPALDENTSISEMLAGTGHILSARPKTDTDHVLLYTGTVPHLIQIIKMLDIQTVLTVRGGKLSLEGFHNASWDMIPFDVDQFLLLHGLEIKRNKIQGDNMPPIDTLKFFDGMNMDSGKLHLHWKKPKSSNFKKHIARMILDLRLHLGRHTMVHHIDDELMRMWIKNSEFPLELNEEEE